MFKKLGFTAVLAGVLLVCPAAFAQRTGHAAGARGFSGGHSSGPAVSGRGRAYGAGYGGYRGYGGYGHARGYAGPRFGVGLGLYGSAYYPGYAAACRAGFRDRFGYWHPALGCYAAPY
jgi:hypothetical protein